MKIPEMPIDVLDKLAEQIKPLVRGKDGNAYHIEPVELDKVSYIWDPKRVGPPVTTLHSLGEFRCLHRYGHPSLFKPSIGEVLRQIPAQYLDNATHFEMVKSPNNVDDMNEDREATRAGFHVSTIRVYGNKP